MRELDALLLSSLETALEGMLQMRPGARARLQRLSGRSLKIVVTPWNWSLTLLIGADQIELLAADYPTPDATLKGDLVALAQLLYQPRAVLFGKGVEVDGDATLVQKLSEAFADLELDLETWFADQFGDSATALLLQARYTAGQLTGGSVAGFAQTATSYLQEELRLLPARTEYEIWARKVDQQRARLESLERRITKLEKS